MKGIELDREQLKQYIQGTPATIPTAFDNRFNLDNIKMKEMTEWWVASGLGSNTAALKVLAAMGEGPDINDDEWPKVLDTVVKAAGSDKIVLCALKSKNTLHTIEDAKKAQDLGALGLQIELPYNHHSNQDDLVRHFSEISDAIDIGIMIYNTWWFCMDRVNHSIQADTMMRLKDTNVVAIKWSVPEGEDYDGMTKFSSDFKVIDNSGYHFRATCFKNGGSGYISNLIVVNPSHDIHLFDLYKKGFYDQAEQYSNVVTSVINPWEKKAVTKSGGYRQGKGLLEAIGRSMGPPRPPTLPCTKDEIEEAKQLLKQIGWI